MSKHKVLVTGASGFIGKPLVHHLAMNGFEVVGTVRSEEALTALTAYSNAQQLKNTCFYNLGNLDEQTDWSNALTDVDTIIHCAARAHILKETDHDPLAAFRQINCQATEHLANQAINQRVKRIIFISSIGVLGNSSANTPFNQSSLPNPNAPYAQSKLEAETTLKRLSGEIEIVIVRPPLVYGPEVKGNFKKLLAILDKGFPLPFGAIKNRRHFIGLDNLVDFITHCISAPQAANRTFLVADDEFISTTQLLQLLSRLLRKKTMLIPVPAFVLTSLLQCIGKRKIAEQLLHNLEINTEETKAQLDWEPPYSMLEQMQRFWSV